MNDQSIRRFSLTLSDTRPSSRCLTKGEQRDIRGFAANRLAASVGLAVRGFLLLGICASPVIAEEAAPPLISGPQVGGHAGIFHPLLCNGNHPEGSVGCMVCMHRGAGRDILIAFVRENNELTKELVGRMEAACKKHNNLGGLVSYLATEGKTAWDVERMMRGEPFVAGEKGKKLFQDLKELAKEQSLNKTILTIYTTDGPTNYRISPDAALTFLVVSKKEVRVLANIALRESEFTRESLETISQTIEKALSSPIPERAPSPAGVVTKMDVVWMTDYDVALAKAKQENKYLLAVFAKTGEFRGPADNLEYHVLNKEEFTSRVVENFVPVYLPLPGARVDQMGLSEDQLQANLELSRKLEVNPNTRVLLVGGDGEVSERTAFQAGGPGAYLVYLESVRKRAELKREMAALRGKAAKAEGLERAKLLDQLIEMHQGSRFPDMLAEAKEIIILDPQGEANLKTKYSYQVGLYQAMVISEEGSRSQEELDAACKVYEGLVKLPLDGEQLQEIYHRWGTIKLDQEKPELECYAEALPLIEKGLAAAPKGPHAAKFRAVIANIKYELEASPE